MEPNAHQDIHSDNSRASVAGIREPLEQVRPNNYVRPMELQESDKEVSVQPDDLATSTDGVKQQYCGKDLKNKSFLDVHTDTHSGEPSYKCGHCQKSFFQLYDLEAHVRTHTNGRSYKCELCERSFSHAFNLKTHIRTHTGERPYQCQYCPRAFTRSHTLEIHIRTHTGERPYTCEICLRSFAQLSNLKQHMLIHAPERPHQCKYCPRSFNKLCRLKAHIRRHTPHQCPHCSKSFDQLSHWDQYIRGHHPSHCPHCRQSFLGPNAVMEHIDTCTRREQRSFVFDTNYHRQTEGPKPLYSKDGNRHVDDNGLERVNVPTSNATVEGRSHFDSNGNGTARPVAAQPNNLNFANPVNSLGIRLQMGTSGNPNSIQANIAFPQPRIPRSLSTQSNSSSQTHQKNKFIRPWEN